MRWIDGERRKNRSNLCAIERLQPGEIRRLQFLEAKEANPALGEGWSQLRSPAGVLLLHQAPYPSVDDAKGLGGGQAIHAAFNDFAFHLLLDARDAHLEELVKIRADDAKKLHAFEQGIPSVEGLVENPLIKFQPAQLTVEEVIWRKRNWLGVVGFQNGPGL